MKQDIDGIIIPQNHCDKIKQTLSSSKLETTAFLFGKVKSGKLIATDVLIPNESDYEKRTFGHVHVKNEFVIREFSKYQSRNKTLLATIHSQPMRQLSSGDIATHLSVIKLYPNQLSGVFCDNELFFYQYNDEPKLTNYKTYDCGNFNRQIGIFGEEGQLLISTTTITLIGMGGGNTKIAFDLASMGFGKLVLIDPDRWEESNRNRVFISPEHVGMYKAESVRELIKSYYSNVEVDAVVAKAEHASEKYYRQADIFVVGPDTVTTRIFGNRLALEMNKTAIFPAAGIDVKDGKLEVMGGSVQVVTPNATPCFECVNSINSLDVDRETTDAATKKKLTQKYSLGSMLDVPTAPSIVSLNDVIAGLAIWEIVKLVTQIDKPIDFQVYDALKPEIKAVQVSKNSKCPACGEIESASVEQAELTPEQDLLSTR